MRALLQGGPEDRIGDPHRQGMVAPCVGAIPIPARPEELTDHYDLTISHPAVEQPQLAAFERWLAAAAAARGLSCALIHDGVVAEATRRLEAGQLTIGYHLDYFALWHVADDPYARLSQAVQDAGGWPVNLPARARLFTDKAAAHAELVRHSLAVPPTLVLRPGCEAVLTPRGRQQLGLDDPAARIYIKPANGFCGRDVRCVAGNDQPAIEAALKEVRDRNAHDSLLIQREARCPGLMCDDGVSRPAYWRVLCCLGEMIPFWWSKHEPGRPSYRRVTHAEVQRHQLAAMLAYVRELASLSRLDWFSTELCMCDEPQRRIVAIDYFNDQCDVDVQSRWCGAPPDDVVQYLAVRFANAAWRQRGVPVAGARGFGRAA